MPGMTVSKEFNIIPQTDVNSCWAASLAMVSGAIDTEFRTQTDFIRLRNTDLGFTEYPRFATTIPDAEMADFTAKHLQNYKNFRSGSLGLHYIAELANNRKPVIYDYKLNSNIQSHLAVIDKVENISVLPDKRNIAWMHISDPWPVNYGNSYYISYERYYCQGKIKDSNAVPDRKYTISLLTEDRPNFKNDDNNYLANVLFSNNCDELIRAFLKNIESLPDMFNDKFYEEINFEKSLAAETKVSRGFRVLNVGNKGTFLESDIKIETLLGMDADTYVYFLSQNENIKTIISAAKVKNPHNPFGFDDNWILNHVERADRFESMEGVLKRIAKDIDPDVNSVLY